jgi:hypothetical protein
MLKQKAMATKREKLWPYKSQLAFVAVPLVWLAFVLVFVAGQHWGTWHGEMAAHTVIVVAIISVLPLLLVVLDFLVLSGAVLDIKGVKLDFSKVQQQERAGGGAQGFELPENAGVAGAVVSDTSPMTIQQTLSIGSEHRIVVANIKSGKAWWVTRLLVLCAGAVRTGSPDIVVFLGKKENVLNYFLGFGRPADLLEAILGEQRYRERYDRAVLSTRQFLAYKEIKDMVPTPPLVAPPLAQRYVSQPDYLALGDEVAEQILLDQLGNQFFDPNKVGSLEDEPDKITISRLNELFAPCLYQDCIDLDAKDEEQIKQLFAVKWEYVALTRKGVYSRLLRKRDGEELILRQLALPKEETT